METHSHHCFGDATAGDSGAESAIESPRDEEGERDREEDEPFTPSKCDVESVKCVVRELDRPHECCTSEADQNAEDQGGGEECRCAASGEQIGEPSPEVGHSNNGNR